MAVQGDFIRYSEVKIMNIVEKEVRKKEGDQWVPSGKYKTICDVCSWGGKIEVEVDSRYASEVKTGVVGSATVSFDEFEDLQVRSGRDGNDDYVGKRKFLRPLRLLAFEPFK